MNDKRLDELTVYGPGDDDYGRRKPAGPLTDEQKKEVCEAVLGVMGDKTCPWLDGEDCNAGPHTQYCDDATYEHCETREDRARQQSEIEQLTNEQTHLIARLGAQAKEIERMRVDLAEAVQLIRKMRPWLTAPSPADTHKKARKLNAPGLFFCISRPAVIRLDTRSRRGSWLRTWR